MFRPDVVVLEAFGLLARVAHDLPRAVGEAVEHDRHLSRPGRSRRLPRMTPPQAFTTEYTENTGEN